MRVDIVVYPNPNVSASGKGLSRGITKRVELDLSIRTKLNPSRNLNGADIREVLQKSRLTLKQIVWQLIVCASLDKFVALAFLRRPHTEKVIQLDQTISLF